MYACILLLFRESWVVSTTRPLNEKFLRPLESYARLTKKRVEKGGKTVVEAELIQRSARRCE